MKVDLLLPFERITIKNKKNPKKILSIKKLSIKIYLLPILIIFKNIYIYIYKC